VTRIDLKSGKAEDNDLPLDSFKIHAQVLIIQSDDVKDNMK